MKVKKFKEFFESIQNIDEYIDKKMEEFKDLIDKDTNGQNLIYDFENKDIIYLVVTFEYNSNPIKFEMKFNPENNDGEVLISNGDSDNIKISTLDAGLELIEKRIFEILNINENFKNFL